MKREELSALRERVEKATGEDDEELLIIRAMVDSLGLSTSDAGNILLFASAGAFLSAAVLLVEATFPRVEWNVSGVERGGAYIFLQEKFPNGLFRRRAATPALALIAALLNALENDNG